MKGPTTIFVKIKHNFFIYFLVILLVVFVSLQLYLLTNVGTKGQQLNEIRTEQSQLEVENQILQAKILELRSDPVVLTGLEQRAVVEPKAITVIDPEQFNIAAQN